MANFILIYPEIRENFPSYTGGYNEGVCSICTCLEALGHKVKLIHITDKRKLIKDYILNEIADFNPDLIGFSVMSPNYKYASQINKIIKKEFNYKTILGGVHGMFDSMNILKENLFDFIAVGEGECCLPELIEKMDDVIADRVKIRGVLTKNNYSVERDGGCFVKKLDILPIPEREFFNYKNLRESKERQAHFIAGRGCPYNCTYCANKFKKKILGSKEVRFKSPQRIIEEIKNLLIKYNFIETIFFQDDILPLNKKWFFEFADLYRANINKPFSCNIHPLLITSDICSLLTSIGCTSVQIGIESGNVRVRNDILLRKMTNEQINEKINILRKFNIKFATFNIIGNYTESFQEALDTLKLNAELKPFRLYSTIFIPYPGTELNLRCKKENAFSSEKEPEYYPEYTDNPIIRYKNFRVYQIIFIAQYFKWLVLLYRFLPNVFVDIILKSKFFPFYIAVKLMKWLKPKLIFIYITFIAKYKSRFS